MTVWEPAQFSVFNRAARAIKFVSRVKGREPYKRRSAIGNEIKQGDAPAKGQSASSDTASFRTSPHFDFHPTGVLAEMGALAVVVDQNGKLLYANGAAEKVTGYSRTDLFGMTIWDVIHPDFEQSLREQLNQGDRFESKIVTKNGEERWVELAFTRIQIEGAPAILGVGFDVTDRKREEEDLQVKKIYLDHLIENAPEGIVLQSNDGHVLRANVEFCRMFGYKPEEIIGQRLDSLIAPEERREEASELTRLVSMGERFSMETIRRRKDGSRFDVSILATPIQVETGQIAVYVVYRDITEHKLADQALIESEAKFRAVADTAASAIYIHTGGQFLYVNRASELISGYSREELLQMNPYDLILPQYQQVVRERGMGRLHGDDVPKRYEFEINTKNGEVRWLDFTASVIQFNGQNAILGTAFDITERKRAEQLQSALYRIASCTNAAKDLDALFASIHAIVAELIYAKNFYIALYDEQTQTLDWRYFVDEMDKVAPTRRELRRGLTEYVLRTGKPLLALPDNFDQLVSSGEVEPIGAPSIDWLGVPLELGNKILGVIVAQTYTPNQRYTEKDQEILTFVSQHIAAAIEHKRDQDALRESESRYRSLFLRAAYGICRSAPDGSLHDVNPAMVNMLGYESAEEVCLLNLYRDVYASPEEHDRALKQFHEHGQRDTIESRWRRKDGKFITVRSSGYAVYSSGGELEGYDIIVEDITERCTLEDQFRHAQKMEAVGRLAGGVAHDFNNLLTVIKGYSELILQQFVEADPIRIQVEEIRKAADRAATLTRQLLAFSRRQVLAPKVLDLNAVVGNMDKLLKRLLGEDVELVCSLAPELGHIKADPGQIEQVVMNLAVNARDAMPHGGRLRVETRNISLDRDTLREQAIVVAGRYVMLAVTDNGHGMTEEVRSHVFEPFFTTKERGTGLGLSTVYGIVKQSGGYVWVYSEDGRGTTFKIYLPRVDDPPDTTQTRPADPGKYRGTETILLVEDEDGVRTLVRQMLQRQGYTVLETRNPGEALLIGEGHRSKIHLLLTDVVLSQMSGSELAQRLIRMRPDMRVLYVSGYTEEAIIQHGVFEPGIAFLQKPFTAESLAQKLREVLEPERIEPQTSG